MNTDKLRNKYLLGFLCLMLLNGLLIVFLLNSNLAQTLDKPAEDHPPIVVEIVKQEDCPLLITLMSVDNSIEKNQTINFSVQNLSSKKIRSYVLFHADEFGVGGASIRFFSIFAPAQIGQDSFSEARANIKSNGKMFLSVDYVKFADGSSWGKDTQKQSEYISGQSEGTKTAVKQIKQLIISRNKEILSNMLQKEMDELNPPDIDEKKSAKWRNGLVAGYRSVLISVRSAHEQNGMEAVSLKIEEIEKLTKEEK
jgi:gas vesicle protein